MLAQYLDLAPQMNNNNGQVVIDVSNYDYVLVQPIGQSVVFECTIDSGAVPGETDGNASTAINFVGCYGVSGNTTTLRDNVADGAIIRFGLVGRYIKIAIDGTGDIQKLLVMLAKIS